MIFDADDLFKSGIKKRIQMGIEIQRKIGKRLAEGQKNCKALINGFLDYMTEEVLKTGCSEMLVDDMGLLLDLYDCHCNQTEQDKNIFYTNILANFMICFEELNKDESRIVLDKSDSSTQKYSIKRSENVISFAPSDDKKEDIITLFDYINREFVKNRHSNEKLKK